MSSNFENIEPFDFDLFSNQENSNEKLMSNDQNLDLNLNKTNNTDQDLNNNNSSDTNTNLINTSFQLDSDQVKPI